MGAKGFGIVFIPERAKYHESVGCLALNFAPKMEIIINFTGV